MSGVSAGSDTTTSACRYNRSCLGGRACLALRCKAPAKLPQACRSGEYLGLARWLPPTSCPRDDRTLATPPQVLRRRCLPSIRRLSCDATSSRYADRVLCMPETRMSPQKHRISHRACCPHRRSDLPGDGDHHPEDLDQLRSAASMPVLGADADWREFRCVFVATLSLHTCMFPISSARLVAGETVRSPDRPAQWAHTLPAPEQGCLLIAHPLMFMESQVRALVNGAFGALVSQRCHCTTAILSQSGAAAF